MSVTKPLAILLAVLVAATGVGAAVGSTHDAGDGAYAMDAQLNDGVVTVTVTEDDDGVENATVEVDGEAVGETDADGTVAFERPDDEFEVSTETASVELESEYAVDDGSLVLEGSEFEMEDEDERDEEAEDERDEEAEDERDEEAEDERDEEAEDERDEEAEEIEDDERDENAADGSASADAGAADAAETADRQGPPSSLPAVVPDRVSTLLGSIFGDGGPAGR
ncbi:hypothetical protein [Haloplanus salilacus]|uniref:hypothetical protein n=1 Tax=Haloplanus salilacus TaxID=2949994 RepID=UPI0030CD7CF8